MATVRIAFASLLVLLLAAPALAQVAGHVQFVSGVAEVERGGARTALAARDEVRRGDTVLTGADGLVQLAMIDKAFVSLRPRSRLRIDEYRYDAGAPNRVEALLFLGAGIMRTFTGEIVGTNRERFRMKTPLASVGIRGSGNILAHLEETGTLNHTLTGAHSVTSVVDGFERTLVSYPGQTIQVRPGMAPRYVPTPPAILAAAAPVSTGGGGSSSESSASSAQSAATGTSSTAPASSGTASSVSSPPTTTLSSDTAAASVAAAPAASAGAPTAASATGTSLTGPTASTGSTSSSSSQAAAAAVGAQIVTQQANAYEAAIRFYAPISSGGYEGVLGTASSQDGAAVVLDSAGRLTQLTGATLGTYITGPGATPPGYSDATYTGTVSFSGGQHADGFRSSDGSVILGRWSGGTVTVDDGAGTRATFDLGPRSAPYVLTAYTPAATLGTFTGTAVYNLAAATAPTDAAGHIGTLSSATISANFSSQTITGNLGLAINGGNYALSGAGALSPGDAHFAFASSLANLTIGCSGNCSSAGYVGTVNGAFSGPTGQWIGIHYRINDNRVSGGGYGDFIVGSAALNAASAPAVKVMPVIAVATPGHLEGRRPR